MLLKIGLLLSVLMQVVTAVLAIGLIKRTRYNISWILISVALLMMAVRLMYELPEVVDGVIVESPYRLAISWMGVAISLFFLIGIIFIRKIFNQIREADNLKKEMDRKVLEAIIKTEETERKRVAKELHDGLGPLLSNLKMSISVLNLPPENPQKELLSSMKQVTNESITAVREISNNLSPHVLENFGLLSAIKAFTGKMAESKVITFELEGNIANQRFHPTIEITLYRVICELIHNTLNHAGASQVFIRFMKAGGFLFIIYKDNGSGLPPGKDLKGFSGMGFANIESRLKAIGGTIELAQSEHQGFSVSVTCPLVIEE